MICKIETSRIEQLEYVIEFFNRNLIRYVVTGTAILYSVDWYKKDQILYITGCTDGIVSDADLDMAGSL